MAGTKVSRATIARRAARTRRLNKLRRQAAARRAARTRRLNKLRRRRR